MTSLWTASEAAAATGGQAIGDWGVSGVSIDTRSLIPGDLFVALTVARDAHDFVAAALAAGAGAALVSRIPEGVSKTAPLLLVKDVQTGLEDLGRAARARSNAKVVAITGSVGKTTTKEMLRAVLSVEGKTHAAEASYNNHWGVPLTLARMPQDTEFAVIEIGMSAPGEIAPLTRLVRPHVAVVTTVAAAHLEAFGRIEGIADEKASLYQGLELGGIAIANADLETSPILIKAAVDLGFAPMLFGIKGADLRLETLSVSEVATVMKIDVAGTPLFLRLSAPGAHFAVNALASLAVISALDLDLARAALALAQWRPVAGRGTRETLQLRPHNQLEVELIDDAFNANPASLMASLNVLAGAVPQGKGRRIAILGDMLELGPETAAMHARIAEHPALSKVDVVHTCGPLMAHLRAALSENKRGHHAQTAEELVPNLLRDLTSGDILLVKGSKGSKVSRVVDALRKLGQAAADQGQGIH
jgi:UDP-N-acetylmuramoyl-tripeptide--D-alanyl-D-alanine ligase